MAAAVTRYQKKALSQRVQCVAAHLQRVELYKAWLRAGSPWRCRCATPACRWHSPRCAGSGQGWLLETGGNCAMATGRSLRRGIPDRSVGISEQSCAQSSQPSPGTWPEVEHGWHRLWAVRVVTWRCHSEEEVMPWGAVPGGLSPMACYPMLQPRAAQAPGTGSWQRAWQHPGRFSCQVPHGNRHDPG